MSDDAHIKAYEEAGKYVMHELTLINNRLTWILTIHGFLYATYGLTLQKQLEVAEKLTESGISFSGSAVCDTLKQSQYFSYSIAVVGIFISLSGWFSIAAACATMKAISKVFTATNFDRFKVEEKFGFTYYIVDGNKSFPHLLGGGVKSANIRGNLASQSIPFILLASWIFAIGGIVYLGSNVENRICPSHFSGSFNEINLRPKKHRF